MRVRPLALSAGLRASLQGEVSVLAAAHRNGASLALRGADETVFVSAPGGGLLPAHIVVRQTELARLLAAVAQQDGADGPAGATLLLQFDLRSARVFTPRLAPGAVRLHGARAQGNVRAVAAWLCAAAEPLGLGETAAQLLSPDGRWSELLARTMRGDAAAGAALRTLIGRGAGTTPAGDDMLIGALAYAWAAQGARAPLLGALRRLLPEIAALTTAAGTTYLRAAARGEFGSHLIAWARALPRVSPARALQLARRLAGHGATSGRDTLAGFLGAHRIGGSRG